MNKILCVLALSLLSPTAAQSADVDWPIYYYGDPVMRDVADEVVQAVGKTHELKRRYPPEASVLILTGELVSGPDYCVAILRVTAQSTQPPFRFRSSVGSSHEIFNGVQGACPGEHDTNAGNLAIEEFMTQIRRDLRDAQ